jgi:hypothetical protein
MRQRHALCRALPPPASAQIARTGLQDTEVIFDMFNKMVRPRRCQLPPLSPLSSGPQRARLSIGDGPPRRMAQVRGEPELLHERLDLKKPLLKDVIRKVVILGSGGLSIGQVTG